VTLWTPRPRVPRRLRDPLGPVRALADCRRQTLRPTGRRRARSSRSGLRHRPSWRISGARRAVTLTVRSRPAARSGLGQQGRLRDPRDVTRAPRSPPRPPHQRGDQPGFLARRQTLATGGLDYPSALGRGRRLAPGQLKGTRGVDAVAFTPDGSTWPRATGRGVVRLWDVAKAPSVGRSRSRRPVAPWRSPRRQGAGLRGDDTRCGPGTRSTGRALALEDRRPLGRSRRWRSAGRQGRGVRGADRELKLGTSPPRWPPAFMATRGQVVADRRRPDGRTMPPPRLTGP